MIFTKPSKGFTLIEMMIAIAIIGILITVAMPYYNRHIMKSRRSDATTMIYKLSLAEEKYRTENTAYTTLAGLTTAGLWSNTTTSENGYYTLDITNNTASGYVITATAVGNQANDAVNSTSCSSLTFTMANGVDTRAPAGCWR